MSISTKTDNPTSLPTLRGCLPRTQSLRPTLILRFVLFLFFFFAVFSTGLAMVLVRTRLR